MRKLYLQFLQLKGYSKRTISQYMWVYDRFQKYLNNSLLWEEPPLMQELTTAEIRDFLMANKYNRQIFFCVKSIYEWLFYDDFTSDNLCEMLDTPKRRISMPDFLSVEEIDELLSVADTRERTIIHLMFATGMRVGEVAQVQETDIMLASEMIKIHGKGNKERFGLLYPDAVRHLDKWLLIRRRAKLKTFWGDHPQKIFVEFRPKIIDLELRKKMERPHILRHSFATHMVKGGADIMVVKELLGHESIMDTEKYVHISGAQIRQAVEKVFNVPRPKGKKRKLLSREEIKQYKALLK